MKYLIFFAVFFVATLVQTKSIDNTEKSNYIDYYHNTRKEYLDLYSEKLEKNCPGASEQLKKADKLHEECIRNVDDSLTLCSMAESYLVNCTLPFLQVADKCLPKKARGLPTLGVKILRSIVDYVCKQPGEMIFEMFNPCWWKENTVREDVLEDCEDKMRNITEEYKEKYPSASEFCNKAGDFRVCVKARVSKTCKNVKTSEAIVGLYEAFMAPCDNITL